MLLIGGKLHDKYIDSVKSHPFYPKGKNKEVTFIYNNPVPFKVKTSNGMKEKPINIYVLPAYYTSKNTAGVVEEVRYFETSVPDPRNKGLVRYIPNSIDFARGRVTFNADEKPDLFYFLANQPDNAHNALYNKETKEGLANLNSRQGKPFIFSQAIPALGSKEKMKRNDLVDEAKSILKEIYKTDSDLLCRLCVGLKLKEFEAVEELKASGDMEAIRESIYALCESNPQAFMDAAKDAKLDLKAKVQRCIQAEVFRNVGGTWKWGVVHEEHNEKTFCKTPVAFAGTPEEYLLEWLAANKKGIVVIHQMDREIECIDRGFTRQEC